jgi:hypothetical protein
MTGLRVSILPLAALAIMMLAMPARAADTTARSRSGDDPTRAAIDAATNDAVEALIDDISRLQLTRRVSVGQFLRDTAAYDDLRKVLRQSEQVGGPRWSDDRTCQVELQVSGTRVAAQLRRIAAAYPDLTPVQVSEVAAATRDWDRRSFSATGQAIADRPVAAQQPGVARAPANDAAAVVAVPRGPWEKVSPPDREKALVAAREDAVRHILRSVGEVSLTRQSTVADVLSLRDVGRPLEVWLLARPLEHVSFRDDLQVVVALDVKREEIYDQFKSFAIKQKEVPLPRDDREWDRFHDQFVRTLNAPIGRAPAPVQDNRVGGAGAAISPRDDAHEVGMGFAPRRPLGLGAGRNDRIDTDGLLIPRRPPSWISRQIDAEATADSTRGRLHAARNAEAAADQKLRAQIEALPLSRDLTLGQAAQKDPRVARALDDALARARIGQTKYHEDGTATVQLYLDLEQVWDALERAR